MSVFCQISKAVSNKHILVKALISIDVEVFGETGLGIQSRPGSDCSYLHC